MLGYLIHFYLNPFKHLVCQVADQWGLARYWYVVTYMGRTMNICVHYSHPSLKDWLWPWHPWGQSGLCKISWRYSSTKGPSDVSYYEWVIYPFLCCFYHCRPKNAFLFVLLLPGTGNTVVKAVSVLKEHAVLEENIILANLFCTPPVICSWETRCVFMIHKSSYVIGYTNHCSCIPADENSYIGNSSDCAQSFWAKILWNWLVVKTSRCQ